MAIYNQSKIPVVMTGFSVLAMCWALNLSIMSSESPILGWLVPALWVVSLALGGIFGPKSAYKGKIPSLINVGLYSGIAAITAGVLIIIWPLSFRILEITVPIPVAFISAGVGSAIIGAGVAWRFHLDSRLHRTSGGS